MAIRNVHLVCNAHIDPVWLWDWEEGAAEALATFRTAADFCAEFPGFVFNHNEAILYKWVEEYEPDLFRRIQRLVRAGKWHIMGGWYLQPDCNMPAGESFVRQILIGKRYFQEKFGVNIRTAVNLDPFGHTRGLVQILARSGYDSYLYCRPALGDRPLPAAEFAWVGYDGSEVRAVLATEHYNSAPGKAAERLAAHLARPAAKGCSLLLWGIGNHGGGPSRHDLEDLQRMQRQARPTRIKHSTPEDYIAELRRCEPHPPRHTGDLNPWAVGCYTSMIKVKQRHRQLENELYLTEKMLTCAAAQKLISYPRADLNTAACDLATSEFHDALPGSAIPSVEQSVLRVLDHGREILARLRMRAFFALAAGQPPAQEDEFPILVYNPHLYKVRTIIECELQPRWPHGPTGFLQPRIKFAGRELPAQAEKEQSNINEDHRKRVVFPAVLQPGSMNRFVCRLEMLKCRPRRRLKATQGRIRLRTSDLEVQINTRTGLLDRYRVAGTDYLKAGAGRLLVMQDNADPWGMTVHSFRRRVGCFKLLSRREGSRFSGVCPATIPSVRIIEDGPIRSVIEAVFAYRHSFACVQYTLPKSGAELAIVLRVHWAEKDRMLKFQLPTLLPAAHLRGQVAYGVADLPADGSEVVAQKWIALAASEHNACLTCVNDGTYGADVLRGDLRISLLRSPAHAGHPTGPGRPIVQPDRHTPRIDQGERCYKFWLSAGPVGERLRMIDREALVHNERPPALNYFPSGNGERPQAGVVLSDKVVQLGAFKVAESNDDLIIRLFEPTGRRRTTTVSLPWAGVTTRVDLAGYEIKTLRFKRRARKFVAVDLLEEPVNG